MPTDQSPLSGDALHHFLLRIIQAVRHRAGVRSKLQLARDSIGMGALRYFGASLGAVSQAGLAFMEQLEPEGYLKGLGFTAQDYAQALARMASAHETDVRLAALAADARAESVAARAEVAALTLKLEQSRQQLLHSHLVDETAKTAVRDAGLCMGLAVRALHADRQRSRSRKGAHRTTQEALVTAQEKTRELLQEEELRTARMDLELQHRQGAPLRPADLVLLPQPSVLPAKPRRRHRARVKEG